ncbi:MAG TPA: (4Fe-4S)-binding protein [Ferruginibacter sp.]|nr:(4Fe-4S)-binding protein [Ferruginibacter sp.]
MAQETHHYSNGEITVVWKPKLCIHSGICAKGLPKVFDPHRKPWVETEHADSRTIIEQVRKCPSGALSIIENVKE